MKTVKWPKAGRWYEIVGDYRGSDWLGRYYYVLKEDYRPQCLFQRVDQNNEWTVSTVEFGSVIIKEMTDQEHIALLTLATMNKRASLG